MGTSKNEMIGWGLIGCGVIAPSHAEAIQKIEGVKLVACCDLIADLAEARAKEYGDSDTAVYSDLEKMLADPNLDAVSICTPSGMHADEGILAAQAGKHILCEKPLDVTLKRIDALIAAAEDNRVKLAGVFQSRTYESTHKVREAIRTGKLGKLVLGDSYQKYFRSHEYYASGEWRATWELDGGGALMNQGVHGIDLLLHLMGDVRRLNGRCRTLVRNIGVEDTAVASLEFVNGALGVIEGTTSVTPGMAARMEISGDNGTIVMTSNKITVWDVPGEEIDTEAPTDKGAASDPTAGLDATGHVRHISDLADAIRNNREPEIPGREARRAVEVIKAIYLSSRRGGATVELPLSYEDDGPGIDFQASCGQWDW
ncbi:MAG: Gfo/Idh/MocA family oxidoreductase [candidate division WS1 bacterium]|nr:Gfo/Idh/MocA family oxidoreductase [candidate division WS1 bacterium]